MTRSTLFRALASVLLLACSARVAAQDWSQWRGPARTGITAAFRAPANWPDRPTQAWRVKAGTGHSSPVVSGARVFLHSRIGEREAVSAYDLKTGKTIWQETYEAPYTMNPAARGHGKGPKSTPVVADGRLFTFGIGGILSAWNASSGALAWRKDFAGEFPATSPEFGVAMSPIVAGGVVIVHAGGPNQGAVLALDPATGGVKWSWKGEGPAYASPIVAVIGGTRQVITQSRRHVVALALGDGRLLWQIPFTTAYDQNIVTAVVANDLVVYSGIGQPLTAVRVTQQDGKWSTAPVWQNAELPLYMSSPVLHRGYLYGFSSRNRGQFFCVDLASGKVAWTTRGREAENAAVIISGDLLMATTTEGELVIANADPGAFEPLKRYTIAESPVWAHPVPAASGVLIKDAETLTYWTF